MAVLRLGTGGKGACTRRKARRRATITAETSRRGRPSPGSRSSTRWRTASSRSTPTVPSSTAIRSRGRFRGRCPPFARRLTPRRRPFRARRTVPSTPSTDGRGDRRRPAADLRRPALAAFRPYRADRRRRVGVPRRHQAERTRTAAGRHAAPPAAQPPEQDERGARLSRAHRRGRPGRADRGAASDNRHRGRAARPRR